MSACEGCAGSGLYVATQDMLGKVPLPSEVTDALLDAEPMPAIVDCPTCEGTGEAPACRVCGCTDSDCIGCFEKTGEPCHWVERNLCSACAP